MQKVHIRTYRISNAADVTITHWNKGEKVELTPNYKLRYDRHALKLETSLDVFRYENGTLAWSAAPNGQDVEAARSLSLLLELFVEDCARDVGDPRCF